MNEKSIHKLQTAWSPIIARQDNTRVQRPVIVRPIKRTLKPGEQLITIRGKKVVVKPQQAEFRQDNRSQYQVKQNQKRSEVLRKKYEEEKNKQETSKTVGALLTLATPSTYIGPILNPDGKSYMDNLMSGQGTGDETANLAIDLVTPFVASGASKAVKAATKISDNARKTIMRTTGTNRISKNFANPNDGMPWALKDRAWDQDEIKKASYRRGN